MNPSPENFISIPKKGQKVCVNEKIVSVISIINYLPKDCFRIEMENTIVSTFYGEYFIDSFVLYGS